jgi:hypothetical protein
MHGRHVLTAACLCLSLISNASLTRATQTQNSQSGCLPKQPSCERATTQSASSGMLRDARPGVPWLDAAAHIARAAEPLTSDTRQAVQRVQDVSPPQAPGAPQAEISQFSATLHWSPASDPESGIAYYAFALGSGDTPATASDVVGWQSVANRTDAQTNVTLMPGRTIYVSVYAVNGAGMQSSIARSGPLTVHGVQLGAAENVLTYTLAPQGIAAAGALTDGWSAAQTVELRAFLDRMLPVLRDRYGPPSVSANMTLVRDLRRVNSAIFYPSTDAIHLGDSATYQLITHELAHAWRNDRLLSSDASWRYVPTYSGFEEGFAQAVSYAAMTEFAHRYPDFPLTERVYQSSVEWDYDFQNVPELGTTDFWSDYGGTQLFWIRYEASAAVFAKVEQEHAGFYRAFNAEYYRRLNANPTLTITRPLLIEIIATVAPVIEGRPAAEWIERQHVLAARVTPGRKIWRYVQHYPSRDYHVFNRLHTYETFANGSDWAMPALGSGWRYYGSNGITGTTTLRDAQGTALITRSLQITPTVNPPALMRIGYDELNLSTAESHLPWPGGDAAKFITNLLPLQLYALETTFISGTHALTSSMPHVIGAPLRDGRGIWGGVRGARRGQLVINHRDFPIEAALAVRDGAFWGERAWASLPHTATGSIDTAPGMLDIVFTDELGAVYTDTRAIQLGSWTGSQAFLFDLAQMHRVQRASLRQAVFLPLASAD